jgi:hypothetical protein
MDSITQFSEKFDSAINHFLEPAVTNKYVMPVLALILVLYVTFVRPTLPQYVQDLFHNNIFRFFVLAYIVYRANHDIQSAILLSAVFLITMHMVNKQYVENFGKGKRPSQTQRKAKSKIRSKREAKDDSDLDNLDELDEQN